MNAIRFYFFAHAKSYLIENKSYKDEKSAFKQVLSFWVAILNVYTLFNRNIQFKQIYIYMCIYICKL